MSEEAEPGEGPPAEQASDADDTGGEAESQEEFRWWEPTNPVGAVDAEPSPDGEEAPGQLEPQGGKERKSPRRLQTVVMLGALWILVVLLFVSLFNRDAEPSATPKPLDQSTSASGDSDEGDVEEGEAGEAVDDGSPATADDSGGQASDDRAGAGSGSGSSEEAAGLPAGLSSSRPPIGSPQEPGAGSDQDPPRTPSGSTVPGGAPSATTTAKPTTTAPGSTTTTTTTSPSGPPPDVTVTYRSTSGGWEIATPTLSVPAGTKVILKNGSQQDRDCKVGTTNVPDLAAGATTSKVATGTSLTLSCHRNNNANADKASIKLDVTG